MLIVLLITSLSAGLIALLTTDMLILNTAANSIKDNSNHIEIPSSATSHSPIDIDGNVALGAFCSEGSGTEADPYIIENLEIDASSDDGINIMNTDAYLIINGCTIENGLNQYEGISMDNSSHVTITNNQLIDNNIGIQLWKTSNNTISGNNCSSNTFGIKLSLSNNNTITENNCSLSYKGIDDYKSNNTNISKNICTSNDIGITVTNLINSTIWANSLFGNQVQARWTSNAGSGVQWFYNETGNYYGDYLQQNPDATNDGFVWETPYQIGSSGEDPYPLVCPYGTECSINGNGDDGKITGYHTLFLLTIALCGVIILGRKSKISCLN